MWFEQLADGVKEGNTEEAVNALYSIMYYYFTAVCFAAVVWVLWKVIELRAVALNLGLTLTVFGFMFFIMNGLRRLKSWAKWLLLANYAAIVSGAASGLAASFSEIFANEVSPSIITAIFIYLFIILLFVYGVYLFFSPSAKQINWR